MNSLIEMARRGYDTITTSEGQQGPFTNPSGNNFPRIVALKAVNGTTAVIKVRNVYGYSEDADLPANHNIDNGALSTGVNMTLEAGEIELVTCYQYTVVSGTVRAYINTNPPL